MMAWKPANLKDTAVFVLTPELSAAPMQAAVRTEDDTAGRERWREHAKTMIWIGIAIMLALALGQLH